MLEGIVLLVVIAIIATGLYKWANPKPLKQQEDAKERAKESDIYTAGGTQAPVYGGSNSTRPRIPAPPPMRSGRGPVPLRSYPTSTPPPPSSSGLSLTDIAVGALILDALSDHASVPDLPSITPGGGSYGGGGASGSWGDDSSSSSSSSSCSSHDSSDYSGSSSSSSDYSSSDSSSSSCSSSSD